jgi:hypothetical protein
MTKSKCPHCDEPLTHAYIEAITVQEGMFSNRSFKGVSYLCSACHSVLSVGLDPFALKDDIAAEVVKRLRDPLD